MKKRIIQKTKGFIRNVVSSMPGVQDTQVEQVLMSNQYRLMKKLLSKEEMPSLDEVGFRVHSEFEEDGILLYIFSLIGTTNKRVVEICAGNGAQCMAANLIVNHGWEGLLFDGDERNIAESTKFFASHRSTFALPPIIKHAWITRENINELIGSADFKGEIDLLSLDIDGNDYYIMEAIDVVKPRVIICEVQNVIPSDLALTIPYREDFHYKDGKQHEEFRSVSLLAMTKLLNKKGYRLVGGHQYGFNAFFILNGVGEDYFPEVSVESVCDNPFTKLRVKETWEKVKGLPWVEI